MVMHARKYQRLNDGYYDREPTHPYEEKNPSKHRHYNDHYTDNKRQSPNFHCVSSISDARTVVSDSPPPRSAERYQNKASYIERNKEDPDKDKSIDKHQYHNRVHKGGKDGRNKEQKERDHRAEVRKSAIRVCGDWSEHISSSGKCYYYNCKTEVSRWEKPKEWVDKIADASKSQAPKSKDSRERRQQHGHPGKKYEDRQKHSISATATSGSADTPHQQTNSRTSSSFGSPAFGRHPPPHEHSGNGTPSHKHKAVPNLSTNSNNTGSSGSQNSKGHTSYRTAGMSHGNATWQGHEHVKRDTRGAGGHVVMPSDRTYSLPDRSNRTYENRGNCDGSASVVIGPPTPSNRITMPTSDYNGAKHERSDYEDLGLTSDSQQTEDMDISPGSTPTEESMMEQHGLIATNVASTPVSMATSTPPPSTSRHSPSTPNILSVLSNLTSLSGCSDLPALASLSSLTSPGGPGASPGSLLPQLLQQLVTSCRAAPSSAQGQPQHSQQVLQQAIQVLQQLQQTLLMQQKQQQQRQLQQLLVTQLHQLQQQLQHQQQPQNKNQQDTTAVQQQQQQQLLPSQQPMQQQPQPQQPVQHTEKLVVEDGSQSPYSPPDESDGTPLQSPEHNPVVSGTTLLHGTHLDRTHQSPASDHSLISSRRASPAPSHTSSQNMSSLATSQLTAAHRKDDSAQLSSALAHYYDESLIGHVAGLIYDQTEKQADLVAEESHTVGSILCTQVSADLKGARSLVRAGEIISTLYEQRLLFIRQQIKDLDNWRTQNTFMPSVSSSSNRQGPDT